MASRRLGHTPLALITGGSSGMGLEYSRQLAAAGCNLLIVSIEEEKLKTLEKELHEEFGVSVRTRWSDLSAFDAAEELFGWCQSEGLEVDILINNAGIFFFKELSEEMRPRMEIMMRLHNYTPARL